MFGCFLRDAAATHGSCVLVVLHIVVVGDGTLLDRIANDVCLAVAIGKLTGEEVVRDGGVLFLPGNATGLRAVDGGAEDVAVGDDGFSVTLRHVLSNHAGGNGASTEVPDLSTHRAILDDTIIHRGYAADEGIFLSSKVGLDFQMTHRCIAGNGLEEAFGTTIGDGVTVAVEIANHVDVLLPTTT